MSQTELAAEPSCPPQESAVASDAGGQAVSGDGEGSGSAPTTSFQLVVLHGGSVGCAAEATSNDQEVVNRGNSVAPACNGQAQRGIGYLVRGEVKDDDIGSPSECVARVATHHDHFISIDDSFGMRVTCGSQARCRGPCGSVEDLEVTVLDGRP